MPWVDIEDVPGLHLKYAAIVHRGGGAAGDHDSNVSHVTSRLTQGAADVDRPLPTWLISGTADRYYSNVDQLELTLFKDPDLVGLFKPLEDYFIHKQPPSNA